MVSISVDKTNLLFDREVESIRVLISRTFANNQVKCKLEHVTTKALLGEFAGASSPAISSFSC